MSSRAALRREIEVHMGGPHDDPTRCVWSIFAVPWSHAIHLPMSQTRLILLLPGDPGQQQKTQRMQVVFRLD